MASRLTARMPASHLCPSRTALTLRSGWTLVVAGRRLAQPPALGHPRRSAGQRDRARRGPPLVFVHGLAGSWQNWLEQLPVFAPAHRVVGARPPGFGHSPMPREQISISGYARLARRAARRARDRRRRGRRQLDGRLHRRGAGDRLAAARASAWCSSPPPGSRTYVSHARCDRAASAADWSGTVTAYARMDRRRSPTRWRAAAAARGDAGSSSSLIPAGCRRRSPPSSCAAPASRGSSQALEAILDYDFRERLPEIACPTLIVWGDSDQ